MTKFKRKTNRIHRGKSHDFRLEPVLGDGISVLRSFSIALEDVFKETFPVYSITKSLRRDLLTKHGFYQQISPDNLCIGRT